MTMRLPRSTARRLIVIFAVMTLPFGWFAERRYRFARTAKWYESKVILNWPDEMSVQGEWARIVFRDGSEIRLSGRELRLNEWHREMAGKYRRAAHRPWLPVSADPPEPK
jgi:hypothetical protein